jgi:hypothetical protein
MLSMVLSFRVVICHPFDELMQFGVHLHGTSTPTHLTPILAYPFYCMSPTLHSQLWQHWYGRYSRSIGTKYEVSFTHPDLVSSFNMYLYYRRLRHSQQPIFSHVTITHSQDTCMSIFIADIMYANRVTTGTLVPIIVHCWIHCPK